MDLIELVQKTPEVAPDISVTEAVTIMSAREVGAVAVTVEGRIVGVFTERDLMLRVVHERKNPDQTPMREVMTRPVWCLPESTSVADAAIAMQAHQVRHLAIVDGRGKLLGMVALRHSLRGLLDDLERKVGDLEGYIMVDGPGG